MSPAFDKTNGSSQKLSTKRGPLQLNYAVPYPHINVYNHKYKVMCNVQEQFLYCPVGSNAQHLSPSVSPASVHLATRSHLDFCLMAPSPDFFASQMFLDMEIRTVHLFIELDSEFIPSKSDSEYSVFICERWQLFADSTGVYGEYSIPLSPLKSHFMPKI